MQKIHTNVDIHRPASDVFAYLEDPTHHPEWLPSLIEVRNVTGSGEGQRWEWTYKMAGIRLDGEAVLAQTVSGERLVVMTKGPSEATWTFVLSGTENGAHLDLTVDYTIPVPVLGKLAEKMVLRMNEREIDLAARNIKDYCES